MSAQLAISGISESWNRFESETHIGHISSKTAYKKAVAMADDLLDRGAMDDGSKYYSLFMTLSDLIYAYDQANYPAEDVSGADMLRFLMSQHGLTQGQVPEIGGQSLVSDILRGARKLTVEHIKKLSQRFGVSPASFF